MAYNLIDVYLEFGEDNKKIEELGIAKLIELAHIDESHTREELIEVAGSMSKREFIDKAKSVKEEILFNQIERRAKRENQEVFTENDDACLKCKRQAQVILGDIEKLRVPIDNMKLRIKKWNSFSMKFHSDKEMLRLKNSIDSSWNNLL